MAKNEAKIKFTADTQRFTQELKSVNSSLSSLRAAMALNESAFKNTGDKAEYLKNKQKILSQELEQSKAKQEALNGKLEAAVSIYGENSEEAQQWATKLTRAQREEEELKAALSECNAEIDEQAAAEEKAQSPLEQLNTKIAEQKSELAKLKTEYANVVLAQGKDSAEAQELKGKIDALNRELDENEEQLRDVTDATDDAGEATDQTGSKWTVAKQILADLASDGLRLIIDKLKDAAREVVNLGMEFTSSLSNVQALSGATTSEMAALESAAKELGRSTVFSASQVSDAFGYMALAGWDTSDMLAGIDGVLNLAAAGNMDLARASDIVTDNLTAFGLSAEDSGKFVDQMSYAMANSNTDVEQLGEAYKNVASTASSLGYSVEDTTAVLMTMANAGVKGSEAGTGLSTIMTRLATDTKGCATELEKYGVEVYDQNGNMNDLSDILNGVALCWNDLTQEEQASLAKTIAGTSQYSKFQTIMSGLSDEAGNAGMSFNDYKIALENCEGTADSLSSTMQDNLGGDLKALDSAAEGLGLQLFEYFEGDLRGAAQLATDAINGLTDAITPQRTELTGYIEEVEAANEQVQALIDKAQGSIDQGNMDVTELEAYQEVLEELAGKTDLNVYQQAQLRDAVEHLKGSVPGLTEAFDEEKGVLNLTNEELTDMFNNAKALAVQNSLLKAQSEAMDAYTQAVVNQAMANGVAEQAQKNLNDATAQYGDLSEEEIRVLGQYNSEVGNAQYELGKATTAQEEANQAVADAQGTLDQIEQALPGVAEQFGLTSDALDKTAESAEDAGEAAGEAEQPIEDLGNTSEEAAKEAEEAAKAIVQAYTDMRDSIRDSMQNSVSFMDEFSGGAEITAEEIKANLESQISGIQNWSANMQRLSAEAGSGMRQEMYDALVQMGPESANLVQALVDSLEGNTPLFEEICNDWATAMDLSQDADLLASGTAAGANYASYLSTGITDGSGDVQSSVETVVSDAASKADTSSAAESASKGLTTNMQNSLLGASGAILLQSAIMKAAVTGAMSGIKQSTDENMGSFKNAIDSAMTSAVGSISTNMSSMEGAVSRSMGNMRSDVSSSMTSIGNMLNTRLPSPSVTDHVSGTVSGMRSKVQAYVNDMRNALGVTLRGPNIQTPHFSMYGEFNAKTKTVPHVSVSWYAKGAIFQQPTIFGTQFGPMGVGEAGPEAVLPIERLKDFVADAMDSIGGSRVTNVYMTVEGTRDPDAWGVEFAQMVKHELM